MNIQCLHTTSQYMFIRCHLFFFYHPRPWIIVFCEYVLLSWPSEGRSCMMTSLLQDSVCIVYIVYVTDPVESWNLVKGRIQAAIFFRLCPRSIVTKLSRGFQLKLFYLQASHVAWLHFSKISFLFVLPKKIQPLGVECKWRNREAWKEVRKMYRFPCRIMLL